jgi:hypothetical protein
MEIKNLFDSATYEETRSRIESLTPSSTRLWGKMSVSQMLAHCIRVIDVSLADRPGKANFLLRLMGPLFRSQLYNNRPWKKGLPTAPDFIISDERDFEKEKTELLARLHTFSKNPSKVGNFRHPVFGNMTREQWSKSIWKHLDHHLRQFGQ